MDANSGMSSSPLTWFIVDLHHLETFEFENNPQFREDIIHCTWWRRIWRLSPKPIFRLAHHQEKSETIALWYELLLVTFNM